MTKRELFLLTPYTYPASMSMSLAEEDMASWMNAYSALWHPAVLWGAASPPRVDIPYDYEDPQAHHVYSVPEAPPSMMSEDWEARVQSLGAVLVKGTEERATTMEQARQAYANMPAAEIPSFGFPPDESGQDMSGQDNPNADGESSEPTPSDDSPSAEELQRRAEIQAKLLALDEEQIKPFLAVGLGYLLLASLSEAMEHENLLETEQFWEDVQKAIAELVGVTLPSDKPEEPSEPQPQSQPEPADESQDDYSQQDDYKYDYTPEDGSYEDYRDYESKPSSPPPEITEPWLKHLQSAALRLQSAREVLYPVTIYLLDIFVPDSHHPDAHWPASFEATAPLNVIASASMLETISKNHPELWQRIREGVDNDSLQVCGGCYLEREDTLLPMESQFWNLLKGREVSQQLLGKPINVFARKRFYAHPQLPMFLSSVGLNRALMLTLDDSALPNYQSPTVSWPSPDGKVVDVYVRAPLQADNPEVGFNLGYHLYKTIREDHSATVAFMHGTKADIPWMEDFVELTRFGSIFGEWVTYSRYFDDVMAGEHTSALSADEFHFDYLSERVAEGEHHSAPMTKFPASGIAEHHRLRRRMDACWTLAAMFRGLAGKSDSSNIEEDLSTVEDSLETTGPNFSQPAEAVENKINEAEAKILQTFADRLLSKAKANEPGYLIINPCSYKRRVALELPKGERPLPVEGIVKACQLDPEQLRVVLEIPALGFAWIPKSGPPGTPNPKMRMKLADDRGVRNEFFEVDIDPETGGIQGMADRKTQIPRLVQRLIFNPGSTMKATSVKVTSVGPALGEMVAEGEILGDQQQLLARYKQRYRVWSGRPVLEMRIEIHPEQPAAGYPWHAFFGSRFAWRDERTVLLRGFNATRFPTNHSRPQTPDFLEIRGHGHNTVIFPAGLPFLTKSEGRIVDLILMPEHETCQVFDIAIGLDREFPMLTSQGLISPVPYIPVEKGPPHIGSSGWLYHLDMPNLLLTSMRPGGREVPYEDYAGESSEVKAFHDAITVRLFECASASDQAEFRCVRDPLRAAMLNARGERLLDNSVSGDAVFLEVTPGDFNQLLIEFSEPETAE